MRCALGARALMGAGSCRTCAPHHAEAAPGLVLAVLTYVISRACPACLLYTPSLVGRARPCAARRQALPAPPADARAPADRQRHWPVVRQRTRHHTLPRYAHALIRRMRVLLVRRMRASPGAARARRYSFSQGPVHFLQLSTEEPFGAGSGQWVRAASGPARTLAQGKPHPLLEAGPVADGGVCALAVAQKFAVADLQAVNRNNTPWVVVGFHRRAQPLARAPCGMPAGRQPRPGYCGPNAACKMCCN